MHTIRYSGSKKERCEARAKVGSCICTDSNVISFVSHSSGWTTSPRWDRSHANPLPHLKILTSPHWRCCGWWDPVLSCIGWRKVFVYMPPKIGSSKEGNANQYIQALKTCEQFFPLSSPRPAQPAAQSSFRWAHFHGLAFQTHSGQMENNWHNLEQYYRLKSSYHKIGAHVLQKTKGQTCQEVLISHCPLGSSLPPLSVSQRLQIMVLSLLQVSEHGSPSPLPIRVFHVLLSRLIFLPFVEHCKPCCSCSVWV